MSTQRGFFVRRCVLSVLQFLPLRHRDRFGIDLVLVARSQHDHVWPTGKTKRHTEAWCRRLSRSRPVLMLWLRPTLSARLMYGNFLRRHDTVRRGCATVSVKRPGERERRNCSEAVNMEVQPMPLTSDWLRTQTSGEFLHGTVIEPLEIWWSGPRVSPTAHYGREER